MREITSKAAHGSKLQMSPGDFLNLGIVANSNHNMAVKWHPMLNEMRPFPRSENGASMLPYTRIEHIITAATIGVGVDGLIRLFPPSGVPNCGSSSDLDFPTFPALGFLGPLDSLVACPCLFLSERISSSSSNFLRLLWVCSEWCFSNSNLLLRYTLIEGNDSMKAA